MALEAQDLIGQPVEHKVLGRGVVKEFGPGTETMSILFERTRDIREVPNRSLTLVATEDAPALSVAPPPKPYREMDGDERREWERLNVNDLQKEAKATSWGQVAKKYGIPKGSLGAIKVRWNLPIRDGKPNFVKRRRLVTKQQAMKAIREQGTVAGAADRLGVSRSMVYAIMKREGFTKEDCMEKALTQPLELSQDLAINGKVTPSHYPNMDEAVIAITYADVGRLKDGEFRALWEQLGVVIQNRSKC